MRRYADATGRAAPQPGPLLDTAGVCIGEHQGLAYYTVGQRKGLGVSAREPLHVLRLDPSQNAVIVGPAAQLERTVFTIAQTTSTADSAPTEPFTARVKLRYKAPLVGATVTPLAAGRAEVRLDQPARAITPGQAAVFYGGAEGAEALGGGIIE